MKIVSYRRDGQDSFGVVTEGGPEDGHAVDVRALDPALGSVLDVLCAGALPQLAEYARGREPDVALAEVTLLPPVIGSAKVLCAGVNYAPHRLRDWQFHTNQWTPGKNFPGTGGFGPWLVTADEVGPPAELELVTRVNDQVMLR